MKRTLKLLLLLLLITAAAVFCLSCDSEASGEDPEETVEVMGPPIAQPLEILRSDTAGENAVQAAVAVRNALQERGSTAKLVTDWIKRGEEPPALNQQIVVGLTNRTASVDAYNALRDARPNSGRDWSITECEGSVLILGVTDAALQEAAQYFIDHYMDENGITVGEGLSHVYKYPYKELSIDGESIFSFGLKSSGNVLLAGAEDVIRSTVSSLVGYTLPETADKMIALSVDTSMKGQEYAIKADKNGVSITGATYDAAKYGAVQFLAALTGEEAMKAADTKASLALHTPVTTVPEAKGSYTSIGDPKYLIEDVTNMHSGWDYQMGPEMYTNAASMAATPAAKLPFGSSDVVPAYMSRPFQPQSEGILTLETYIYMTNLQDFTLAVYDSESAKNAVSLQVKDTKIVVGGEPTTIAAPTTMILQIRMDLDKQEYHVMLCNIDVGTFAFTDKVPQLDTVSMLLGAGSKTSVTPTFMYLYTDAPVSERFWEMLPNNEPFGFELSGKVLVSGSEDVKLDGEASMKKSFAPFNGKAVFEVKFDARKHNKDTDFVLSGGGKDVLTVSLSELSVLHGSDILRLYDSNFWYTLRVVADTRNQYAEVKINGKSLGYFPFENKVDAFDSVRITTGADDALTVDDIFVYQQNEYDDYCPAPLSSGSDDYYVACQVCSLWRNGHHWGWDCTTPYDELRPVLGYYDEGNVEVADWEIKYMAEHGIDYQLYCWYNTSVSSPIKTPGMYEALHDGFFNAKYSDQMKFAIMWENANGTHPGNSENFRNVIVPYWVEYYLTDPRYMTIDNKPVITVFSSGDLTKDFGSAKAVKEEFDYLREVCKGLGYDGALIYVQAATYAQSTMDTIKSFGADATYAYNWGKSNTSATYISNVSGQYNSGMGTVPTISVGFNNVAWKGTRSALITLEDYKVALEWVRDTYSQKPKVADNYLGKSVVLSTWNEYGEGTYIMPSGLHGFGYLDAVHDVFAPDNAYEDLVPTEKQLARLSTLFVQDRKLLRADYREDTNDYDSYEPLKTWEFSSGSQGWSQGFGLSSFSGSGGSLKGTTTASDFSVMSPSNLGIDLTNVMALEVTMKCTAAGGMEIFYTTEAGKNWVQDQSFSVAVKQSEDYVTYILPVNGKTSFSGKLLQLRVDPLNTACTFEIGSVRLLGVSKVMGLSNGTDAVMEFKEYKPRTENGVVMLPFDPKTGMLTFLGCDYRWNAAEKAITITKGEHTAVFTVGSDTAEADGKSVKLSNTVGLADGLPVLPMEDLNRLLGTNASLAEVKPAS